MFFSLTAAQLALYYHFRKIDIETNDLGPFRIELMYVIDAHARLHPKLLFNKSNTVCSTSILHLRQKRML